MLMAGVPTHARPWVKLGRLKERERWHAMGLALLQKSVERELSQMKEGCLSHIPTPSLDVRVQSFAKSTEKQLPQLQPPRSRGPIDRQESINVKSILRTCLDAHSANIIEIIGENLLAFLGSMLLTIANTPQGTCWLNTPPFLFRSALTAVSHSTLVVMVSHR